MGDRFFAVGALVPSTDTLRNSRKILDPARGESLQWTAARD